MQEGGVFTGRIAALRFQLMNLQQCGRYMLAVFIIGAERKAGAFGIHITVSINIYRYGVTFISLDDRIVGGSFGIGVLDGHSSASIVSFAALIKGVAA
jgi:hypothetical protein